MIHLLQITDLYRVVGAAGLMGVRLRWRLAWPLLACYVAPSFCTFDSEAHAAAIVVAAGLLAAAAALAFGVAATGPDALQLGLQRDWLWELLPGGGGAAEPWPREHGKPATLHPSVEGHHKRGLQCDSTATHM